MNYIKIFQNVQALSFSVGNNYSEDKPMQTFMDNFHQGGKYSAQIASHQAELRKEDKFTDKNIYLFHPYILDYLNLGSISGCGRSSDRSNTVQTECNFCGGANHYAEKNSKGSERKRKKYRVAGDSDNRQMERTPRKCF